MFKFLAVNVITTVSTVVIILVNALAKVLFWALLAVFIYWLFF